MQNLYFLTTRAEVRRERDGRSKHLSETQKCSESVSVFHPKQPRFAKSSCLVSLSITSIHIGIDLKSVAIVTQCNTMSGIMPLAVI